MRRVRGNLILESWNCCDVDALGHGGRHGGRLDDLQARGTHPMPGRHFLRQGVVPDRASNMDTM